MNRFIPSVIFTAIGCLVLPGGDLRAENYLLDGSHTSIIFGVNHLGYSFTYGRFNEAKGDFVWDNANPTASQFRLAINAASLDTNDEQRDGHLRSADFFSVKQFPQITFVSTKVDPLQAPGPGGATHNVTGNLTMHGVTKQIILPVKKLGEGPGPYGKYRSGFFCQTTLNRSDFGMTNMVPNIGNQIAITISFEGLRQGVAGSGSATGVGSTAQPAGSAPKPAGSGSAPKPAGSGSAPKGSSGAR